MKIIEPRVSPYKKVYVYAIRNLHTALLFGAEKDDFDFILDEKIPEKLSTKFPRIINHLQKIKNGEYLD